MEQQANRIASYFPEYKAAQKSRTTFDSSLQPLISLCSKSIILFEFRSVNSFQVNPWWQTCMFQVTKVVIFFFLPCLALWLSPFLWIHGRWRNSVEGHGVAENGLFAIFYSHLLAMEILKTGRNEKRDEGTSRIVKENMQINILRICKQILTEWLLKNWADHQVRVHGPTRGVVKWMGRW